MQFHFTFDQKRVDYIVNVLAQRPYGEVAEVLQDFAQQMQQQQQAAQQPIRNLAEPVKANGAAQEAVQ